MRQTLGTALLLLFSLSLFAAGAEDRVAGLVAALNGTPEAFEAYAQGAFSKTLLDRGPEKRRQLFQRLRDDFGKLTVSGVKRLSSASLEVAVDGATGLSGVMVLEHEAEAPYRITAMSMRVGGGGGEREVKLPPPPINGKMTAEELAAALDPYLQRLTADELFSGVVVIAKDGKPLFERAYGLASRTYDVPNRTSTRFDVGSINKQFTKAAIEQLRDEGKLALDQPVGRYLADYPNADAKKATLQQLLDHRGGLADLFAKLGEVNLGRFRSNHDWYAWIAPMPSQFEPGTKRQYCNSCYVVLGEVIERLSRMPYEQYVQRNVFDRAGMKATGFFHRDSPERDVATGYTKHGGLRTNAMIFGAAGSAAGGAYATARDLLAFDRTFRKPGESLGYAGGAEGVNAAVESDPVWTVVVLANIDPPAAQALAPLLKNALQ